MSLTTKRALLWVVALLVIGAVVGYVKWEADTRADQNCHIWETIHARDVVQLADTYQYLAQLKPHQEDDPINVFIRIRLPETEAKAKDIAPDFCDKPGLGLPEPDPVIPEKPESIR
jgi:hypothetical protein